MTRSSNDKPFVSIVLPVRNEGTYIQGCLECVLAQDYPADRFEIIVADGMSTDDTRSIASSLGARHPAFRIIDNPGRIVPTGLNAAIGQARGEIIVRVDGHCEIAPDYVSRCVDRLRKGAAAVGGPIETIGETAMARAIAAGMSSRFGVGDSSFRTTTDRTMPVDTVACPAYPRSVLERAGPFDEELVRNQDDEYNYRVRKLGGVVLLAADVRSRYFSRSSLRSLFRQYYQYGYWKVRVLQKHPRQMRARQFVPVLFVASLVVGFAAALSSLVPWSWVLAYVGTYLAANAAASIASCRDDLSTAVRLPVIYAALHVSYGAGFMAGLVAFRKRWRDDGAPTQGPRVTAPASQPISFL